jgi:hypothetical protein
MDSLELRTEAEKAKNGRADKIANVINTIVVVLFVISLALCVKIYTMLAWTVQ